MGDENPIRTLGDYSKPSHEGYRNTIELPEGNNVVALRSDTIRLVQNGCSFHTLKSEDPIQHLKDFLRIVDSIDLNGNTRNTTCLRLLYFSLYDQAINWLDRLPTGSISTWDDLTTYFLAQFFLPRRTVELQNNILRFQQRQDKSLYNAWTRFKDLLLKVPHHAGGRPRKLRPEVAWETINLAQHKEEGWNDPIIPEEEILDYENPNLEQLLGVIKCKEAFKDYVMNFILDQEERVKQLEEYIGVIGSDFMQLSLKEHTPPVTYPEEVEETLGTSIEVEPLDETQLEDLRLNTCNHDLPLSSMEVPSFDESEPQPQPLHNRPPLDRSLGEFGKLKKSN
ncbi:zinc finger, CCHC-type containing protein [Tanacetum coccineum]|uniref:Zinc finger, CCHC-type containing protein n=1 Tax=Tanacetum coccineum TaxID=301880 RepID=A0ABQ4ZN84_9ASTR